MNLRSANALLVVAAMSVSGCGITKVVTVPVNYLFGPPEPATTHNTSDVSHPGRPLPVPSPTPRAASRKSSQGSSTAATKPSPAKKSTSTAATSQFPTAKPVPGKPGLVFNPFKPNAGYIDVSGYASGSKVKDPDTQKIFVVP